MKDQNLWVPFEFQAQLNRHFNYFLGQIQITVAFDLEYAKIKLIATKFLPLYFFFEKYQIFNRSSRYS